MPLKEWPVLRAVRDARPEARIVVDANQGFSLPLLTEIMPAFQELNVEMVEQPLPRGADDDLAGYPSPIRLCADESCLSSMTSIGLQSAIR